MTLSATFPTTDSLNSFLSGKRAIKAFLDITKFDRSSLFIIAMKHSFDLRDRINQPLEAILNPGKCFSYPLKDRT